MSLAVDLVQSTHVQVPTHAHASMAASTFAEGELEDAATEWWLVRVSDGATIDQALGVPVFGVLVTDPGDYVVIGWARGQGDAEYQVVVSGFTAAANSWAAQRWINPSAGADGAGTSAGDPYNSWSSAFDGIRAAWVPGATSQHVIWVLAGTSAATTAFWDSDTDELVGRLQIRPYGEGARPHIHFTGGEAAWLRTADNCGLVAWGLSFDGNDVSYFTRKDVRGTEGPDGVNVIVYDCVTVRAAIYQNQADSGSGDPAVWAAGAFDFLAIVGCDLQSTSVALNGYFLSEAARYILWKDNTVAAYPAGGSVGVRCKTWQHLSVRNSSHVGVTTGSPLRLHSATAGVESQWAGISGLRVTVEDVWIMPDDGNLVTEPMHDVWIVDSYVNAPGQPRAWGVFANSRLVMRNCWGRCGGVFLTSRLSDAEALGASTAWTIDNCCAVIDTNGAGAVAGCNFTGTPSGFRVRNLVVDAPNQTSNNLHLLGCATAGLDPAVVFAECDGNQLRSAAGTPGWANNFSVSGATRATWFANSGLDENSTSTANPLFVAPTGADFALDLHIQTSSSCIGAGVPVDAVHVDYDGKLRNVGVIDAGSHEFGAVDDPTAPSVGGPGEPMLLDKPRRYRGRVATGSLTVPAATVIPLGAAVQEDAGVAAPVEGLGTTFFGFTLERAVGGPDLDDANRVKCATAVEVLVDVSAASGNLAAADALATVYATGADTFTLSSTGAQPIGKVAEVPVDSIGLPKAPLWVWAQGGQRRSQ